MEMDNSKKIIVKKFLFTKYVLGEWLDWLSVYCPSKRLMHLQPVEDDPQLHNGNCPKLNTVDQNVVLENKKKTFLDPLKFSKVLMHILEYALNHLRP